MTPGSARCPLHPEFAAHATCTRCGRFACAQCFRPDVGLCSECGAREPLTHPTPWERRNELGLVKAYVDTLREVALEPARFWAGFPRQSGMLDALLFGWLTTVLTSVPTALLAALNLSQAAALVSGLPNLPEVLRDVLNYFGDHPLQFSVALMANMVITYPLGALLGASIMHVMLIGWRAGSKGFDATFRVQCYAQFPQLLSWVPIVGWLAGLWSMVMTGWGFTKVHQATPGRVTLAILTPVVLVVFAACGVGLSFAQNFIHQMNR